MRIVRALAPLFLVLPLFAQTISQTPSTEINPSLYSGLRWRLLGPFRAGRVSSVAGVPTDPTVYYIATPDGGVWKTTDAGRVWTPTMDALSVSSIGAVTVAPSNPNVVYAGSGEESVGQGMFKSTDAGAHWSNIGLKDSRYISGIIVDPRNADIVTVAVSGPMEASEERGVYRSTDGGQTWKRTLFIDNETGAVDIASTPDSKIQMVSMAVRPSPPPQQRPTPAKPDASKGEKEPVERGPGSTIYISTDAGATWKPAGATGLPAEKRGRIGVAMSTNGTRMFAIMDKGLFRSDDQGKSWKQITTDPRIIGASYFSKVFVNPKSADEVYVAQTSMYRSRDGGIHFESWNGAPSGDDIHTMWINPVDPRHMILGVDQGAIISMNAGATWTEWFNQPTGQFYHVTTDNQFPYHAYAAQQDSGSIATVSRSNYGEITYRDWYSPAAFEVAHILADPNDEDAIYGSGWYSTLIRYSRSTGQFRHLFVPGPENRAATAPPIAFDPFDSNLLMLGAQRVLVSADRGETWKAISPDLTGGIPQEPADKKPNERRRPPSITAVSPSALQKNLIWAGSGDGLIHLTRDGQNWQKVTPTKANSDLNLEELQKDQEAKLPPSAFTPGGVAMIEPGHFSAGTAFAVFQIARDQIPLVVRTRDFGQHWQSISKGLPQEMVWAVREDPVRQGLLYAAVGHGVFVSFDEGDHWQSLQLNLPVSQMRDLNVHGNDLIVATFGRALWVLDDLSPLRQLAPAITNASAHLFKPSTAFRVRWDMNTDTPLPPETPAAPNPPDGALIYYYLRTAPKQISMDIRDSQGNVVSHFDTTPEPPPVEPPNAPEYWFAPAMTLPTATGLNRFTWNLRYPHPPVLSYGYSGAHLDYFEYTLPDHAIASETPRWQPEGPLVPPGNYEVVLNIDGQTFRQPLEIKPDPRVKLPAADYEAQIATQLRLQRGMAATFNTWHQVHDLRTKLKPKTSTVPEQVPDDKSASETKPKTVDEQLKNFEDGTHDHPGFGPLNRDLGRLMEMAGTADGKPSQMLQQAVNDLCGELDKKLSEWKSFVAQRPDGSNTMVTEGCGR